MKVLTFTIPKGGVGKTLLQANVAAALATYGARVIVFDADPSRAMETIMGVKTGPVTLSQVINNNGKVQDALYKTNVTNLYLLPSGLGLESYLNLGPTKLISYLERLDYDYLFVDTPFPMGDSAFLALGLCHYLFMILSEDEFSLCVESGIDLVRLANHMFNCKTAGFVVNRITADKITEKLVSLVEKAFEAPCIARIKEDALVRKSYGGPHKKDAYLFYKRYPGSDFAKSVDLIATFIANLPEGKKKPLEVLENVMKQVKIS